MKGRFLPFLLTAFLLAGCASSTGQQVGAPPPVDSGVDPDAWVVIPAGGFFEGIHAHPSMINYDYEIMVTDVTNAQFAEYLNQALADGHVQRVENEIVGYYPGDDFHGFEHEERIDAGVWLHVPLSESGIRIREQNGQFKAMDGYQNHPMVQVTWFAAKAYCEYYGWELPTEMEWEKAARGEDERPYPWGWEIAKNNANFYSSHDIFEKTFGKLGDTTPVGFYNGATYDGYATLDSSSPYGLYDMAGNVWQWTGDVYEDQHYRYMRGGSKMDYGYNLRVWTRNSAAPYYYSPSVGFRCVR
jgi:formylglycine-generating enzyme required for sulfatase activity